MSQLVEARIDTARREVKQDKRLTFNQLLKRLIQQEQSQQPGPNRDHPLQALESFGNSSYFDNIIDLCLADGRPKSNMHRKLLLGETFEVISTHFHRISRHDQRARDRVILGSWPSYRILHWLGGQADARDLKVDDFGRIYTAGLVTPDYHEIVRCKPDNPEYALVTPDYGGGDKFGDDRFKINAIGEVTLVGGPDLEPYVERKRHRYDFYRLRWSCLTDAEIQFLVPKGNYHVGLHRKADYSNLKVAVLESQLSTQELISWCRSTFGPDFSNIWSPEEVKDNGLSLPTKHGRRPLRLPRRRST